MKIILFLLSALVSFATCWQRNGFVILPANTSPTVTGTTINGRAGVSAINGITAAYDSEVSTWLSAINGASGTVDTAGVLIATNLAVQMRALSYSSAIVYLVPFIGTNLEACRCPLRNTLAVAAMSTVGGGSATCTQSTGLTGNGALCFDLKIKPSQLGTGSNGGLGFWENNINFTGSSSEPLGSYGNSGNARFVISLNSTTQTGFWGSPASGSGAQHVSTTANGNFYWERSSSTSRALYFNGSSVATNSVLDLAVGVGDNNMYVIGSNEAPSPGVFWKGRCACVYLTDGTLGATNAGNFDTFLRTWLFTPTGRPTS